MIQIFLKITLKVKTVFMILKRDRMKGQIIDNIKKIKIITQKVLGHIEVEAVTEEVEAADNKIMMVFKEMKKLLDNSHQKTFNLIIKKMLGEEEIIIANTSKKMNLKFNFKLVVRMEES